MANSVVSLAYYVSRARRARIEQNELKSQMDFCHFLQTRIDVSAAIGLWNDMYEDDPLVSLDVIDMAQTDFQDIVDQIYRGVDPRSVRISAVAPPPAPSAHHAYFQRYLATIPNDTRTPSAVTAALDRLDEVIANRAVATARGNGLIVGRVQSGKTRNYIGLMLKAVDDGWNVVIVLTSAIRALALQTRKRIVGELAKVGANDPRFSCELDFLNARASARRAGEELQGDFFYWGVAMKQVDGLERIRKWFDLTNQPHRDMRVLIIDDESDSATPDSNASGDGLLDDEEICERIQVVRRTPDYEELADWFDALLQLEPPDPGARTHEAEVFEAVYDVLKSSVSARRKMDQIVNSAEYRRFLGMEQFLAPPVEDLISRYFTESRGRGEHSCSAFVLLIRSILVIVRGRSAINAAICHLVGPSEETGAYAYPFQRCAYLGYTATPYANILNEGPSHTPIYADFIQSLNIPPQYFGTDAIFGHDIASVEPRMPIVCSITEDEEARILNPLREHGILNADAELVCHVESESLEWTSLRNAVTWAFCTAAVRRLLRQRMADLREHDRIEHRWTTMIVNVDHRLQSHRLVKDALMAFIAEHCRTPEARAAFKELCRAVWLEQTRQFTAERFHQLFNQCADGQQGYGAIADYPAWEELEGHLDFFMDGWQRQVHVIVMNCTLEGRTNQQLYGQDAEEIAAGTVMELTDDHLWLVSGGNTIGRGLTLSGLTVSYFDRVRDGTCVDTLTQMGRWFGYRPGYELLPRVWMNLQTVGEMKRIAMLELKLHESIADNFEQGFSPSNPAHFQQISSWGRRLSGRAFAMRQLDSNIGTIASADDYYLADDVRRRVLSACEDFFRPLGEGTVRSPAEYTYASTPLWENVDRDNVRRLFERLLPHYPDRSRKILRGVLRDMSSTDPINWDVVIGTPLRHGEKQMVELSGRLVPYGTPNMVPTGPDTAHTPQVRLHLAFYAMIRREFINREDVALLSDCRGVISDAIDARRIANGGTLPPQYAEALPGTDEESVRVRLDRLIDTLQRADGAEPVPEAIHSRLGDVSQGFRNRSSGEYMARVHRSANHTRPVLQLYFIKPEGDQWNALPLVNISFYWPNHEPDTFFTVSVDENPDATVMVTRGVFCQTVEDILRERDFPMQRKELLRVVLERLGSRCNENLFNQHIAEPLAGYEYHKMAGRNAYCIDGWAVHEEEKLGAELLRGAVDILQRDRRPYETRELLEQIILEQPRFRDFYVPSRDGTAFNNLMTDAVLNQNDITVIRRRPMTYCYHI